MPSDVACTGPISVERPDVIVARFEATGLIMAIEQESRGELVYLRDGANLFKRLIRTASGADLTPELSADAARHLYIAATRARRSLQIGEFTERMLR